jgi:hypothetical protein
MNRDRLIRQQLVKMLVGGQAHMGFDAVVANFPLDYINHTAPNVPYTPWHFLEHMRIAQWDILEFILDPNHVSPDYPHGYRPPATEQAGVAQWHQTVDAIRADLQDLQSIATDPAIDLFAPIPHAQEYTIFRELLVVADHNAYHIGELALLRQVMGLWPEKERYLTG